MLAPGVFIVKRMRSHRGTQFAELGAALIMFLPVMMISVLVAAEAAEAYEIVGTLNQAANQAARALALSYSEDPTGTMANPNTILSQITCLNIVKSTQQFNTNWNTLSTPPMVTVTVTFKSGQYGCATFPNPDPLNIGQNFTLTATSFSPLY